MLGVDDAYPDSTRPKARTNTGETSVNDIMFGSYNGEIVSTNTMEMIWEAWRTNKISILHEIHRP